MNRPAVFLKLAMLVLAGCGGRDEQVNTAPNDAPIRARFAAPQPSNGAQAQSRGPEQATPDISALSIRRSELDAVLALGPAALLRRVNTEPVRERSHFVGFRIIGFPAGPPATIDLRIGDIVLAVNGTRIEKPEHFVAILDQLKSADKISFQIRREGADQMLDYPIVQ